MHTLSFDTGIKTFDINGDPERTISFNPTDPNFIHRLYSTFNKLDCMHKSYQLKIEKLTDEEKVLKTIHQADMEIRKGIDGVFGEGTADIVFGNLSTYAITSDGLPLWGGFIVAVLSQCDVTINERENATNPKLESLLAKYKR